LLPGNGKVSSFEFNGVSGRGEGGGDFEFEACTEEVVGVDKVEFPLTSKEESCGEDDATLGLIALGVVISIDSRLELEFVVPAKVR
jgi:hypothetical protein